MTAQGNTYPTLKNAPIEEAIISLTIGRQKHASLQALETLCEKLKDTYPQRKNWKIKEFAFEESEAGSNMSQRDKATGFVISTEDQKKLLHLSLDTLSLNRLRPYGSWEDFSADYKAAWDIFTQPLSIEEIKLVTIRYINSFTIPVQGWEEHLLMRPSLNSQNPYDDSNISMGEVFSQYVLVSERHAAKSVVSLTLKPENNESLKVIMDIDVSSRNPITDYSGYHDVTDVLNNLRDFKNQIFFSNVPKAEELFA
ncbi:MAG: TIGR04255 family protein [Rickettsiales bacterium]|nr:TIGR04255 family protein [Rickettsiales bacterium]